MKTNGNGRGKPRMALNSKLREIVMKEGGFAAILTGIIVALVFVAFAGQSWAAGKLSQDPQALSFLGSYKGTILARGSQRDVEFTLSAIDDNGKVTVSRYHLGQASSVRLIVQKRPENSWGSVRMG